MPKITKNNSVKCCSECKWYDDSKYDAKGLCRGHAPKAARFQTEDCRWPLVNKNDRPCRLAEPKDE